MAKILVAGGLARDEDDVGVARKQFAAALGRMLVDRGHIVLGGCRTHFDAIVAEAAAAAAQERRSDSRQCVRSWVSAGTTPSHRCGELLRSQLENWVQVPRGLIYPETIQEADAVIIVGGWDGTHYAASWARLANKPLLPVATFGQAAAEIYRDEAHAFNMRRNMNSISVAEFQKLNRMLPDFEPNTIAGFAQEIVCLAELAIASSDVFIIMAFSNRGELRDAHNTIVRVCEKKKFRAFKVDHSLDARQRIVPAIFEGIRRSAFVIADLTDLRPNVFYEVGYAYGLSKTVIQTVKKGTIIPFDIYDVPTIFWDSQESLENELTRAIDDVVRGPKYPPISF